jgi:predicted RNase H-like nuclease
VHWTLDDEAIAIVERMIPSPNKRGEWVSCAIIDYASIMEGVSPVKEAGALEALNQRLGQLEKQIAALLRELKGMKEANE